MTTISKLLVAGRGEIALRIMRTAHELDIATVAVCSDPDAGEPFAAAADEAVRLPGATPAETYLRGDAIIAAARAAGAQAVHPGYGFLSENAAFARSCAEAGLTFVGPSPEAIEAMGSKVTARELMAAAGVPVLPGVTVGTADDGPGTLAEAAAGIGYPLLVKAAYGGGGRGMRMVAGPDELAEAVASARREAEAAFGDGTVFAERLIERPRHIEVQVVGDSHGNVTHLFERECSVQRRYQKIIEEAPSPAVDDGLRDRLTAAAVTAAKAIGYTGAGTVEFVLEEATGSFWFLEMNTRLQVEHPVTELVTGLDLVAVQLAVAEGQPLQPEVTAARVTGHAVEARLYAEDPAAGFRPTAGTVHRFAVPELPGVRVDAGIAGGSVIGPYYDPMLAKVIAHGATREQACRRLARALAQARMHGPVTNRDLLAGILREPEFRAGLTDTGYLARHDPVTLARPPGGEEAVTLHAAAAALAGAAARREAAPVQATIPAGWRNVPSEDQLAVLRCGGQELAVRYRLGTGGSRVTVNGLPLPGVTVHSAEPDGVDLTVAGIRRRVSVHFAGGTAYADSPLGSSALTEVPRFPEPEPLAQAGSLLAPLPGTVVRAAMAGQRVAAGDPVAVIEAMKMEHVIRAPASGVVGEVRVRSGQAVAAGTPLARIDAGDDTSPGPGPAAGQQSGRPADD